MSGLVWAVTDGEYSDYRVLCVCLDKANAEAVATMIRGEEGSWSTTARVEAMTLADSTLRPTPILAMSVTLWDDGTCSEPIERESSEWPWDYGFAPAVSWRWVRAPMHNGKGGRLDVRGSDFERVRRVFSDRRAQVLAEDAFRLRKEATGQR